LAVVRFAAEVVFLAAAVAFCTAFVAVFLAVDFLAVDFFAGDLFVAVVCVAATLGLPLCAPTDRRSSSSDGRPVRSPHL
jgi:hypothetical protein